MKKRIILPGLAILAIVLGAPALLSNLSTAMESDSYAIRWDVMGGGNGSAQSTNFVVDATGGQPVVGLYTSGSYQLGAGYWYGVTKLYAVFLPLLLKNYDASRAELIFYNGAVLTLEGATWEAEAIAIQGDRIMAVGSAADVLALQGPGTQMIDLSGRTLMPGFVDAHTHVFNDAWYWEMDMEGAQQLALQNGITTLADMYAPDYFVQEMLDFQQAGKLIIRTSLYLPYADPCGDVAGDWYLAYPPTHGFGEKLRIGGVKIFSDGGVCGMPALSFDYPADWGGGQGDLWFSQTELNQIVAQAHNAGYQVVIHAIGDRAVETAQNAIEFALAGQPNALRHRIEHNVIVRPELLPRYGEIGIIPAIFGSSRACWEATGDFWGYAVGPERLSWLRNYRVLLDANPGLHVTWHGDDPWIDPMSPILELYSLVTRKDVAGDGSVCEPQEWMLGTGLTVEEALPLMTIDAAYAIFREDEVGSLKAGKLADLIVLSADPTAVEPDAIKDIELLMTMVGGRVEYCTTGQEAICPAR